MRSRLASVTLFVLIAFLAAFGWQGILYYFALTMFLQDIPFWTLLAAAIAWHEAGHFLFARLAQIGVQEYCIGIGPKLFSFRLGETRFTFRALLIGGFVDPANWDDLEKEGAVDKLEGVERRMVLDHRRWFSEQPLYERCAMVLAGPMFNITLAISLFWLVGTAVPMSSPLDYIRAIWTPELRGALLGIADYKPISMIALFDGLNESIRVFGWEGAVRHFAFANLGLGFLNLLPLPPLDGAVLVREVVHEFRHGHLAREAEIHQLRQGQRVWGYLSVAGLGIFLAIQFL